MGRALRLLRNENSEKRNWTAHWACHSYSKTSSKRSAKVENYSPIIAINRWKFWKPSPILMVHNCFHVTIPLNARAYKLCGCNSGEVYSPRNITRFPILHNRQTNIWCLSSTKPSEHQITQMSYLVLAKFIRRRASNFRSFKRNGFKLNVLSKPISFKERAGKYFHNSNITS